MSNFNADIFKQASDEVNDKGIGSRIWHSGSLHSFRSATSSKGSAASKGLSVLKSVGQAALSLVPVPIVGSLASAIVDKIDGKLRGDRRQEKIKNGTLADKAKFTLKDLSIDELDRFRWKVDEEYKTLEKATQAFNAVPYAERMCDHYYAMAYQIEQTNRRVDKLKSKLEELNAATALVKEWLNQVETGLKNPTDGMQPSNGLIGLKKGMAKELAMKTHLWTSAFQSEEVLPFHAGCTQWCCVKETAKYNPNMTIWRDRASKVGQGLTFVASLASEEYANFDEVDTGG